MRINLIIIINSPSILKKNNMKKILQILDVSGWAIDELAKSIVKYNPQYEWKRLFLHPKDLEQGKINLEEVKKEIEWADLIDAHYWRTLSQLMDLIPEIRKKKILLTHHNEKNILSYDWKDVTAHMARTLYSKELLEKSYPDKKIFYTANTFDPEKFEWNEEYPPREQAVGYVGRIVPWKGLKEIAKACYELNYPLYVMGRMDKPSYYAEIPDEHKSVIKWDFFNCDEADKIEFYKSITIYVGNSGSGRETGPLGLVEAMAMGIPCVTTGAGIAKDICSDDVNCLMVDYGDEDQLQESIQTLMTTPALQARFRKNAWQTIRNYTHERGAMEYRRAFVELLNDRPLVSVIIPATWDRVEQVREILLSLNDQTYKSIEVLVIWDEISKTPALNRESYSFPIHEISTERDGYNLAMARNLGIIEASGKYLLFCDSRLKPEKEAIEIFVKNMPADKKEKVWIFGRKGGDKESFVENWSMIRRDHIIRAGMMNQSINRYGGMSQELRERFASQGFIFQYIPEAKADEMMKGSLTKEKRGDIIAMKNLLFKLNLY